MKTRINFFIATKLKGAKNDGTGKPVIQQEPIKKKPDFKKPHTDSFLSLAPFYKKLDRLIYALISFSRTHSYTKCPFEF